MMKFKKIFMFLVLFFGLQTFSQDSQPAVKKCEPDLDLLSKSDWDDIIAGHIIKDIPCKKQKKFDLRQDHVMQEITSIIKADWEEINPLHYDGNLDYPNLIISAYEKEGYSGELTLEQTEKLIQQVLLDLDNQVSNGELKFDLNKDINVEFIIDQLKHSLRQNQLPEDIDFLNLILDYCDKEFAKESYVLNLRQVDKLIKDIIDQIRQENFYDLEDSENFSAYDIYVLEDPDFD